MKNYLVKPEQHDYIYDLYINQLLTQSEIARRIGVSQNCIRKLIKRLNWPLRSQKEASKIKKYSSGLDDWRKENKAWNKGLTKNDPTMRALIAKGRKTQIKNGKSKGCNNPMYGKTPTSTNSGFRKDLNHFVRSSWEANFARIILQLGMLYEYEKYTFPLSDGDTYTPDFYIPSKDKFYEIKGWNRNDKHIRFRNEYPNHKLVFINKNFYKRLMFRFGGRFLIDDKNTQFTKMELETKFRIFLKTNPKNVSKFIRMENISKCVIRHLYKTFKNFVNTCKD